MSVEVMPTNMMTGAIGGPVPEQPTPQQVLAGATPDAAPTPEPVATPEPPVTRERTSDKFAALARKEAEVFRKAQAVRAQQAELARQAEEIRAFQEAKKQAVLNPLEALKQLGLTYDQITEYIVNDNKPTPSAEVMTLKQELEEFKRQQREEQDKIQRSQRERVEAEQKQIIEDFHEEVSTYIKDHADTYELTSLYDGANLVVGVIEEHFKQTGKLMNTAEAARLVEEHYEDLARKTLATKKFAATQQKATPPQAQTAAPVPRMGPTLSNDLGATGAAAPKQARTDADRIAAALARLEGR